jgi:Mce-associated membrane protein
MAVDAATPTAGLSEPAVDLPPSCEHRGDVSAKPPNGSTAADDEHDTAPPPSTPARPSAPPRRAALVVGLVTILAIGTLAGWLGFRAYQAHQAMEQRELFLQAGRQGAVNLTTIDFAEADTDIQRILDSATGTFYDDFSKRSRPFVDVVKQAHSKSVGTVTAAGLESASADHAQVLVAVSVKTSNAGAEDNQPRAWRMRISVQKIGDQAKVSNVEFVP